MADVLTGSRIKLARARKHLDDVHAAMSEYIERDLVEHTEGPKIKFSEDLQILQWETVPPAPPMVGAMVGDFVHNVRSALDQAVYALVKANGWAGDPAHTKFPICEFEAQWNSQILNHPQRWRPPNRGSLARGSAISIRQSALHRA